MYAALQYNGLRDMIRMTLQECEEYTQIIEDTMLKLGVMMHEEPNKELVHEYETIVRTNTPTLQMLISGIIKRDCS